MKPTKDALGDRMKFYEKLNQNTFMPLLPICIRLDGKNFSKWTIGLDKPYHKELIELFQNTTKYLVKEINAIIGYTQSDEITLILYSDDAKSKVFFDGKIQKIISVVSSMATAYFNLHCGLINTVKTKTSPDSYFTVNDTATFDCRAWQVPTLMEAVNMLIWRENDAVKNSISSAASSVYSHKELKYKNQQQRLDMLINKGINWNNYPYFFKRGSYIKNTEVYKVFTYVELKELNPKHHAHGNPDMKFKRHSIEILEDFPKLTSISNPVGVIFHNEDILLKV